MGTHRILLVLCIALSLAWSPSPAVAGAELEGEITIVLEDALAANYRGGEAHGRPLSIHLTREGGEWTEAWGKAMNFNKALHEVSIAESHITDGAIELVLEVNVRGDLWIAGGPARYTVHLERRPAADGRILSPHPLLRTASAREELRGHFQGRFDGPHATYKPVGDAVGALWPSRATHAEYELRQTLHRPRLLLREDELPRLEQRLETPLGRAVLERLKESAARQGQPATAIGNAILYRLTEDDAYARAAAEQAEREMTDPQRPEEHETHQSTFWADRAYRVAYAYDLCADTWSSEFREQVAGYLDPVSHSGLYTPHQWGSGAIITPGQSQSDKMYAGCGIAAMTLWGRPGDPPTPPATSGAVGALQERFGAADGLSIEERLERYRRQIARWREAGGANRKYLDDAYYARRMVLTGALRAVGEGGTGGFPYTWDFALAWRSMFGRDISSRPDLSRAAVEPMLTTLWDRGEDGRPRPRAMLGTRIPTGQMLARMLALAEDDLKPAVVWYWLNLAGIEAADLATDAGARRLLQTIALDDPLAMAYVLLYMPQAPESIEPARRIPRILLAETPGTLWARSDFTDPAHTILARFTAKQMGASGPTRHDVGARAGHFEIYGLGHHWAAYDRGDMLARQRFNVVQLPDMHVNGWARGQLLDFVEKPNLPAASLTQDLSAAYRRLDRRTVTRTVTQTRGNLTIDRPVTETRNFITDEGIEAMRSFAVDFSGESGAPGLFAIVDRITGEQAKQWTLHVPELSSSDVTIEGNTFTVRKGDATLTATFIAPADVRIDKRLGYGSEVFFVRGKTSGFETYRRDVITATAADPAEGDFFVVMTLQRGAPPAVRIDGSGLDATATVGNRTLRFDGRHILLGPN